MAPGRKRPAPVRLVRLGEKLPGFLGRLLRLGAGTVDARYLFPQVELVAVACSVLRPGRYRQPAPQLSGCGDTLSQNYPRWWVDAVDPSCLKVPAA